jgi:molybdopterin-biosynthesis enzyme MoeA-like protein
MAGIPSVMQAMLEDVRPRLAASQPLTSVSVGAYLPEGTIAAGLAALQKRFPEIPLGSYPFVRDGRYGTNLVARGSDIGILTAVKEALVDMITQAGGELTPETV